MVTVIGPFSDFFNFMEDKSNYKTLSKERILYFCNIRIILTILFWRGAGKSQNLSISLTIKNGLTVPALTDKEF